MNGNWKLIICIWIMLAVSVFSHAETSIDESEIHYIEQADGKIAYRLFGQGPLLAIINGGPGRASETFTVVAKEISSKGYQVVLFDQRGTGNSTLSKVNPESVTLSLMIDDLEALRNDLKAQKFSLLGHSFGGMYAMAYAEKYPDRIKSLILSASGGVDLSWQSYTTTNLLSRLTEEQRRKYKFWTSAEQKKKDPIKARLESLRATLPAYVFDQKFVPQIEKSLLNTEYYSPAVNDLVWKSMSSGKYNLTGKFKNFKASTLIIDCRQDFLGEEVPLTIHKEIPKSELKFINECSHYPWLDKPDEYFSAVAEFLRKK